MGVAAMTAAAAAAVVTQEDLWVGDQHCLVEEGPVAGALLILLLFLAFLLLLLNLRPRRPHSPYNPHIFEENFEFFLQDLLNRAGKRKHTDIRAINTLHHIDG